jgi:hypothetical protein|tara:strand:+ start:679 stop:1998 length:1320 start_codon:yes stop_codon:yes gene_type:complete
MAEDYKINVKFVPDTSSLKNALGSLGNIGVGGMASGATGGGLGMGKGIGGALRGMSGTLGGILKAMLPIASILALVAGGLKPIFIAIKLLLRPLKDILLIALLPLLYLMKPIGIFFRTILRPYIQRAMMAMRLGLTAKAAGREKEGNLLMVQSAQIIGTGFMDLMVQSFSAVSATIMRAIGWDEAADAIEIGAKEFTSNFLTAIDTSLVNTVQAMEGEGIIDKSTAGLMRSMIADFEEGIEEADLEPLTEAFKLKADQTFKGAMEVLGESMVSSLTSLLGKFTLGTIMGILLTKVLPNAFGPFGKIGGMALAFTGVGEGILDIGSGILDAMFTTEEEAENMAAALEKSSEEASIAMNADFLSVLGPEGTLQTSMYGSAKTANTVFGEKGNIPMSIDFSKNAVTTFSDDFKKTDNNQVNWYINIIRRYKTASAFSSGGSF